MVAAVYLLTLCVLEEQGFWGDDTANKFLQVQAIINNSYSDFSLPWPGKSLDPNYEFNPIPPPFSRIKKGKLFSIYSPVFATVSSFPFRLFGFWGLYILPVVSSVLMLAGLARMAETMGAKAGVKHSAVLIAGLCTPIWFYSVVFWEHIVAVCLCVWGVNFYLQFLKKRSDKYLILGSVLVASSIYFRDELYLFCLVLVAVTLLYAPGKRLRTASLAILAMIVSVIPLWLFQWKTIGQPLGFHLGSHPFFATGIAAQVASRPWMLYNVLVASNPSAWASLVIAAPFIITFLLNPRFSKQAFTVAVPLYSSMALVSSFFALGGYFGSGSPIAWMLHSNSLFSTTPILILAFMRLKNSRNSLADQSMAKWIWAVTLAYAVLYGLTAPPHGSMGIHWGNRFLLVLYPLFAILAAINLVQWLACFKQKIRWRTSVIVLAILVSFAAQVYSIRILRKMKNFSYRLNQEIQKRNEKAVITNIFWIPQLLFTEFYNKPIFFIHSPRQFERLVKKLNENGYKNYIFVTQVPDEQAVPAVAKVDDEGLDFFSVEFIAVEIPESERGGGGGPPI